MANSSHTPSVQIYKLLRAQLCTMGKAWEPRQLISGTLLQCIFQVCSLSCVKQCVLLSCLSLLTQSTTPAVPFYTLSSPTSQSHPRVTATSSGSIPPHLTPHTPNTPSTPTLESPSTPITPVQKQPSKGLKVTVGDLQNEDLKYIHTI